MPQTAHNKLKSQNKMTNWFLEKQKIDSNFCWIESLRILIRCLEAGHPKITFPLSILPQPYVKK